MSDELKPFLVSYGFEGSQWGLEIQARDWDDARARVKALAFAKLDGKLMFSIPAPGILGRIAKWLHS